MWPPATDQAADQHALFENLHARILKIERSRQCEKLFCPHNPSAVADMWPLATGQDADQHIRFEILHVRLLYVERSRQCANDDESHQGTYMSGTPYHIHR
jgi:hypothetical protein